MALLLAMAGIGVAVAGPGTTGRDSAPDLTSTLCAEAVVEIEGRLSIPAQLLSAISLAESGRWDAVRRTTVSWPWAIYAEGRARYPSNKEAAIAEVKDIQSRGVRNIDVGCLQINLFYHPDAFENLEEAFDPVTNTTYAGELLLRLQNTHKSWSRAIAFYHSSTRKFAIPYMRRVKQLWLIEHRRQAAELRDARIEVLRLKKAEREAEQATSGEIATF